MFCLITPTSLCFFHVLINTASILEPHWHVLSFENFFLWELIGFFFNYFHFLMWNKVKISSLMASKSDLVAHSSLLFSAIACSYIITLVHLMLLPLYLDRTTLGNKSFEEVGAMTGWQPPVSEWCICFVPDSA